MVLLVVLVIGYFLFGTKGGRKLLSKAATKLLSSSLKILVYFAMIGLVFFLGYLIVKWIIEHILAALLILVGAFVIFVVIGLLMELWDKRQHAKMVEQWKSMPTKHFTDIEVMEIVDSLTDKLYESDTNKRKMQSALPFGRITYFVNFFEHDLSVEEPTYYSPVRSRNRDEIREYGIAVTTGGIYISCQTDKTDKEGHIIIKNVHIPFSGMIAAKMTEDMLTVSYVEYKDTVTLDRKYCTVPLAPIRELCDLVISSGISKSMYEEKVYDHITILDEKEEEFLARNSSIGYSKAYESAGMATSFTEMGKVFNEVGNTMNKGTVDRPLGFGDAAEYAGTARARFRGDFRAKHLGAQNGPVDRTEHPLFHDEIKIQTKFCQSPEETLEAFLKGDYPEDVLYECPKDQYKDILDLLDKDGDKNIAKKYGKDPEEIKSRIMSSAFTRPQAWRIMTAGTVEGLKVDIQQGIVCSIGAGSITAILTFATCKWNGMDTKDAALQSLKTCAIVMGKSTAVYVITMQLNREFLIKNVFSQFGKAPKPEVMTNPLNVASKKLAEKIRESSVAQSQLGKKMGLNEIKHTTIISGSVVVAVTFGPDICRALVGRISFQQLMKNSAIGAAGIAGAAIGQTVIPIPIIGSMIGGAVAGFIAKKTLDHFIEDDAVEMFAILKEEFMDTVPLSYLNQDEFNEVVEMTIGHKKLPSVLRDMYAYGDSREYAREQIMNVAIQHVLAQREMITEEAYDNAIAVLATDSEV